MMNVTAQMYKPGDVDETRYAAFVAKTIKSNMRARDKANAKGNQRALWFGMSDADVIAAAESYCHMYRHQFRVLVPVSEAR